LKRKRGGIVGKIYQGGDEMTDDRFLVCENEDWEGMNADQRDWLIFKTLRSMDRRLHRLEIWNKCFSFAGGFVGGVVAVLGMKFLG